MRMTMSRRYATQEAGDADALRHRFELDRAEATGHDLGQGSGDDPAEHENDERAEDHGDRGDERGEPGREAGE